MKCLAVWTRSQVTHTQKKHPSWRLLYMILYLYTHEQFHVILIIVTLLLSQSKEKKGKKPPLTLYTCRDYTNGTTNRCASAMPSLAFKCLRRQKF